MRFVSAKYVGRQGMRDVTFENGDHFVVAIECVVPVEVRVQSKRTGSETSRSGALQVPRDWTKMRIGETGDVLVVASGDDAIEIPWDRIRSIADPEFRAHLADRAEERARQIGFCLRAMRVQAGLTMRELAEKVGVPRARIVELEAGKAEPQIELLDEIAIALGRRLRDLADE